MSATADRNAAIVERALTPDDHGHYPSLISIGEIYGLTRERIRQIIKEAGLTKPRMTRPRPLCKEAGCGNESVTVYRYCQEHKKVGKQARRVTRACSYCGKPVTRTEREILVGVVGWHKNPFRKKPQQRWFCDKTCNGKYVGRVFGFNTPNNGAHK